MTNKKDVAKHVLKTSEDAARVLHEGMLRHMALTKIESGEACNFLLDCLRILIITNFEFIHQGLRAEHKKSIKAVWEIFIKDIEDSMLRTNAINLKDKKDLQ